MPALLGFKNITGERIHTLHGGHPLVLVKKGHWFHAELFRGSSDHSHGSLSTIRSLMFQNYTKDTGQDMRKTRIDDRNGEVKYAEFG